MDWNNTGLKKRGLLLIVSVVVMLMALYYGIRDIEEMRHKNYQKSISKEEPHRPDFLPPDAVIINVGERNGSIQKEDYDVILGAIMKFVLGVGFFIWCLLKYLEEKRLTEEAERQKRKKREMEINITLYKEKQREEQAEKYRVDKGENSEKNAEG